VRFKPGKEFTDAAVASARRSLLCHPGFLSCAVPPTLPKTDGCGVRVQITRLRERYWLYALLFALT